MTSVQNPEALLAQTGWIHALARRLVRDPHLAADAAQDAALHALESEPDGARPLRGWLATVLRNRLAKLRRGDGNRAARERTRAPAESAPAADEVVERAETHRNVVLAVLALDEPYRSTILLRFFDQLSYDDIARRSGVTRAAVNSRVTRGLAELRQRLESTYGGDRRALSIALLPLAKLPTGLALTASTSTTVIGAKTMHAILGVAAATLLVTTATVGLQLGERESAPPARHAASIAAPADEDAFELRTPAFPAADAGERAAVAPEPQQREHSREHAREERSWRTEVFQALALPATTTSIAVNTGAGEVELLPSTSGRLEVKARVRADPERTEPRERTDVFEDHVEIREEEGTLVIEDAHQGQRGWSVDLLVSVPAKLPLRANSGSGNVTVRTGGEAVAVNTGSGDVRIELAGERLKKVAANTGSGDVRIETLSIEGELKASTGSGDVAAAIADASSPGRASLSSGSGDLVLVLPANVVGTFELETYGGEIDLPRSFGIAPAKDVSGARRAEGALGSGGGTYRLSSGSGDLQVVLGSGLPKDG